VAVLQIARDFDVVEKFRDVFGMRFLALEDVGNSVYYAYRVPDAAAPYPQDYVIDQDGIVRYWSWEYDPQVIIALIDSLLDRASVEGGEVPDPGDGSGCRCRIPAGRARFSDSPYPRGLRFAWPSMIPQVALCAF
jgi:hypothetical protein